MRLVSPNYYGHNYYGLLSYEGSSVAQRGKCNVHVVNVPVSKVRVRLSAILGNSVERTRKLGLITRTHLASSGSYVRFSFSKILHTRLSMFLGLGVDKRLMMLVWPC